MGPENKIDFGSGTLYLDGIEFAKCGTFEVEEAPEPIDMPHINKIINGNRTVTFTGTCKISFKFLVMTLGFWPAVKWKLREMWRMLRTPVEVD